MCKVALSDISQVAPGGDVALPTTQRHCLGPATRSGAPEVRRHESQRPQFPCQINAAGLVYSPRGVFDDEAEGGREEKGQ